MKKVARASPRAVLQQDQAVSRIVTRYDKLAANYLAFIKLAAIRFWLRAYESAPYFTVIIRRPVRPLGRLDDRLQRVIK